MAEPVRIPSNFLAGISELKVSKMISKGDDYPIHQLPTPISEAGTDRNFYDRYFNGYTNDASIFLWCCFLCLSKLKYKDGSFIFIHEGAT